MTAVYSGDANYPTSTSPPLAFTVVNQAPLTLELVYPPANAIPGVSFQARGDLILSPPILGNPHPSGTMTLFDNGAQIATGPFPATFT